MQAVVDTPAIMRTKFQNFLFTRTIDIIKPNTSSAFTKSRVRDSGTIVVAQRSTHNIGIIEIPSIVTDCSPFTQIWPLYSSFIRRTATHQMDCRQIMNRIHHTGGHYWVHYPGVLDFLSQHCHWFEVQAPIDFIHIWLILNCRKLIIWQYQESSPSIGNTLSLLQCMGWYKAISHPDPAVATCLIIIISHHCEVLPKFTPCFSTVSHTAKSINMRSSFPWYINAQPACC